MDPMEPVSRVFALFTTYYCNGEMSLPEDRLISCHIAAQTDMAMFYLFILLQLIAAMIFCDVYHFGFREAKSFYFFMAIFLYAYCSVIYFRGLFALEGYRNDAVLASWDNL